MTCVWSIIVIGVWLNLYRIVLEICGVPIGILVILAAFPGLEKQESLE